MEPKDKKLGKEMEKDLEKSDNEEYSSLLTQIDAEFNLAFMHQAPKRAENLARLKLFNNQRRDKDRVGDNTMFTVFQTIMASLYDDRLIPKFDGREEGDDPVAENITSMARFDYDEMGKNQLDYFWIWDAMFFSRGIVSMEGFIRDSDRGIFVPAPELWDPTTFLRDPRADSINGSKLLGQAHARFFGRQIRATKYEIENHPSFEKGVDFADLKTGNGTKSLISDAKQARADAQNNEYAQHQDEKNLGDNAEYELLEWNTHWKGNRVKVWTANGQKKVVGYKVLSKNERWRVVDRPLYPTSHEWDGVSIPDLTEDKQRARAIATNLGLDAMKADAYPSYIFDTNKISNKQDFNKAFNKFIPSNGPAGDAIMPMRKDSPNMQLVQFIMETLDLSAQKATASPSLQQGQLSSERRTLGELNLAASNTDTRYSLSAKIFGWSEKAFWEFYYLSYKENLAEDLDEKILRIAGPFGPKFRPLDKKQLTTRIDPDVSIESLKVNRAKDLENMQIQGEFFARASMEPTSNRRYIMREEAKLRGLTSDQIDRMFPKTIDERIASDENVGLSADREMEVKVDDDHNVHLEYHAQAAATPAAFRHIKTHEEALKIKKAQPELFPQDLNVASFQGAETQGAQQPAPIKPVAPSQTT